MRKNKILIIFAHPLYEKSIANKVLVENIPNSENITFHDLYETYPDFDINVRHEQELLNLHDVIIWHHPMYWYSCPPLLKQWIDLVLEYGWAYGINGNALQNKVLFQTITTGANQQNYCSSGRDKYTIPELLLPFKQTATICKMNYIPPFVFHGTHNLEEKMYAEKANHYSRLLNYFENNEIDVKKFNEFHYLNDWIENIKT